MFSLVENIGATTTLTDGAADTAHEVMPDSVAAPEAAANITAAAAAAAAAFWCLPEPAKQI